MEDSEKKGSAAYLFATTVLAELRQMEVALASVGVSAAQTTVGGSFEEFCAQAKDHSQVWVYSLGLFLSPVELLAALVRLHTRRIALYSLCEPWCYDPSVDHSEFWNTLRLLGEQMYSLCAEQEQGNPLAQQLAQYMARTQHYLDRSISRQRVAESLHTNRTYLSQAIQEAYGLTFNEYLHSLRLEYARQALTTDRYVKIEVLAQEAGFGSSRTFYRLFRKQFGTTPVEFRRTALDGTVRNG